MNNYFSLMLILLGLVMIMVGIFLNFANLLSWKMPGDILIKKNNFTLYFPLGTSVLISIVLSIILYLISIFLK